MDGKKALGLSRKYTDDSIAGGGAIKGKNCVVTGKEKIEGATRIHYKWTLDNGTELTDYVDLPDGEKGEKGDRGAIGTQGAQGIQGIQGEKGDKGDQGIQGIQGIKGEQGIQGIQGPKGDDGYPFLIYKQYDSISEFKPKHFPQVGLMFMVMQEDVDPEDPTHILGYPVYRYTGEAGTPYSLIVHLGSQGIKGEKGDKGDQGAQGIKGDKGDQGEKGEKGDKGDQGAQGIQGEQGVGLPEGGLAGAVLCKYSNTDYDFDWKGTTDRVRPNSHDLVESGSVYAAIVNAVSSIYTPRGNKICAELTSALLVEANVGSIYEMSDSGTTTDLFMQGEGETINAGDSVGIVKAGPNTILFNLMGNTLDLTDYQKKDLANQVESQSTVEDALIALSANKQPKTLGTPISVNGVQKNTVEDALSAINTLVSGIKNALFPVNSVYITYTDVNPNTLLGFGSWEKLSDGYLRNNASAATGGSDTSGSHALTVAEMPSHNHTLGSHTHTWSNTHNHGISDSGHTHNHNLASSNWGGSSSGSGIMDRSQTSNVSWNNVVPTNSSKTGITINNKTISGTTDAATGNTGSEGSGNGHTHSIEPTYTRIYAWRRNA